MLDPDYEDLLPLLSVPAAQHDPGLAGVTRRRFLQATLATTGAATLSGTRWAKEAFGSPIAASDGVLVMVMLGGGNDGLNAFAPDLRHRPLPLPDPARRARHPRRPAAAGRGGLRVPPSPHEAASALRDRTGRRRPRCGPAHQRPLPLHLHGHLHGRDGVDGAVERLARSLPGRRHRVRQRHARHHVLLVGAAAPARSAGQGHRGARSGRHVGLRSDGGVGARRLRGRAGLRRRAHRAQRLG